MKTIAISIEEYTLQKLDHFEKKQNKNRSEIVREALGAYLDAQERMLEEERERKIFRRFRKRLKAQTDALIEEQAKP